MLGSQSHEGGSENGILPGGEDRDESVSLPQGKMNDGPHRLADPVLLHGDHPFGPARESVAVFQQFFRIGGDLEEPPLHLLLDHLFPTPPASPRFHLLVGQNGLAFFTPVDKRSLFIGQPFSYIFKKSHCSQR